jgi:hypothetical protein
LVPDGFYPFRHADAPVSDCFLLQEVPVLYRGEPEAKHFEIGGRSAQMRPGLGTKGFKKPQAGKLN